MKYSKRKRKLLQLFFTVGTLAATAAINYSLIHSPLVFLALTMLCVHEIGHYLVSKSRGANPDYPYFIPLFPFVIGVTRIKDLKDEHRSDVAIAGMLFAVAFMFVFIFHNIIFNFFSTTTLFILLIAEIVFNLIGSDGRRYRHYKSVSAV